MKIYCWTHVCCISICLLTGYDHTGEFITITLHTFPVRQCMMCIKIGPHCFHDHVYCCVVNMTTMRSCRIIIGFKNLTCYFTRPFVFHVATSVFEFSLMTILTCQQGPMYTFGRYETLTTTNYLVPYRMILQLLW